MALQTNIFKCTEQSGYYTINQPVSEEQIIDFAKQIISNRFLHGRSITSPSEAIEFLQSKLATRKREVFAVAFLSNKNEVSLMKNYFRARSIKYLSIRVKYSNALYITMHLPLFFRIKFHGT